MRTGLIIVMIIMTGLAGAATHRVCLDGCDYSSIQAAINIAEPGDRVEVESGTYMENVVVDRSLHLVGIDTGEGIPVIDAGGYSSAATLSADGVFFEGFNLTNSGGCGCGNAGIKISSDNNTVTGNTAYDNKYGIYVSGRTGNRISGNSLIANNISAHDSGFDLWDLNYYGFDCADADSNGVCDTPMNVSGGSNMDMRPMTQKVLPLMASSE